MKKVAFLFSGRGSLLSTVSEAINSCNQKAELSVVITNNDRFSAEGNPAFKDINVLKINHRDYIGREGFEREISYHLDKAGADLIILGGFRRIFSPEFVKKYGSRTMNTHPSLLPAFPGDKAQLKAIAGGLRISGATLHFINEHVDAGPIIDQEPVRILNGTTESELKESIIEAERTMIYRAVCAFIEGRISVFENRVVYEGYNDVQNQK
ncbi:phosphoribosylglycinamide formyltransferase [Pantoea stewartii]|uniref:phosphoribosylglycinamide formyltransferase n=1 Tax=Pantoea stewartii TaxID=66269 RepID=UPI0013900C77|nr:phosphoribosylglycinamide formyltransferase [Pantoea stewartii]